VDERRGSLRWIELAEGMEALIYFYKFKFLKDVKFSKISI
jgi:hypothetical protein